MIHDHYFRKRPLPTIIIALLLAVMGYAQHVYICTCNIHTHLHTHTPTQRIPNLNVYSTSCSGRFCGRGRVATPAVPAVPLGTK